MTKKKLRTKLYARNGIYQLGYKPIDGAWKYQSLKTGDKEVAESKRESFIESYLPDADDQIAVMEARIKRLRADQGNERVITCLELDNVWRVFKGSSDYDPISHETMTGYLAYWNRLLPWMKEQGIKSLPEFAPDNAGEFLGNLTSLGIGRATQGKYITFFRRLWSIVSPESECPWKNKRAQGTGGKVKKKPFTLDQQRATINHVSGEYRSLHIIMAYTGLRLVDACNLKVEECFFDRGVIELLPQKTRNRGSDPMVAKIGIHPVLGFTLRTLLCGRKSGYFLPEMAFNYDRDKSSISKRIQADIHTATGLCCTVKPEGRARAVAVYGAHSFRKSMSDRMRESSVDIMVRMQVLGHKDSRSETQDYSYVSDDEVIKAVSCLPDLLAKEKIKIAV